LRSLAEYINSRGPYIKKAAGADTKIIILYDFEESKTVEAWETISNQVDTFRNIPGFTLSAHIFEKGKEVKGVPWT
jgi:hypothetical protein